MTDGAHERRILLLASGDKRAMIALCADADAADLRQSVAGRVLCLESILRGLVARHGVAHIGPSFVGIAQHQTLQVIFSDTNLNDQARCLATIDRFRSFTPMARTCTSCRSKMIIRHPKMLRENHEHL